MTTNKPQDMEAEVIQQETAREADENRGPTIVMQGVSGKKITADVKVVKIRKKAGRPAAEEGTETSSHPVPEDVKKEVQPAAQEKPAEEKKPETPSSKETVKTAPAAPASSAPAPVGKPEEKSVAKTPEKVQEQVQEKVQEKAPGQAPEKKPEAKRPSQPVKPEKQQGQNQSQGHAPVRSQPAPRHDAGAGTQKSASSTTESRPVPGAVVDPQKSSLAATAALFAAQQAARKKAAEQRARQSAQRSNSPANQNRNNAFRNNGPRPAGGSMGGGPRFQAKDKDDEPKLQSHSRKPAPRKSALEREIMSNPREQNRSTFNSRDTGAGRRTGRGNDRRDNESRNAKSRTAANRRKDFFGEEDEFGRGRRGRGPRRKESAPVVHAVLTHVGLPEAITVKELAEALKKTSAEVIKVLMKLGVMASLNQDLDFDTAAIVAGEFGIQAERIVEVTEEDILFDDSEDKEEDLQPRPPVVVVMGHVDHGKTSLLDRIRQASVASGEAGGITQHIGAYMVEVNQRKITFLDTPGHEAFTTMRARGAQATDVAILVVAADDGVMPQTIEAIHHAQAAKTQIVVAINKMDRPGANPDRVKEELAKHELIPEEWGGSTVMVPVSAKTGEGVQELLEMVLLTADILDLKANPNRQAKGIVIEAKLDKQRGAVATLLVNRGTLHTGDTVVMGEIVGRIRAMSDAQGKMLKEAGPSVPVEILGMPDVPEAGETFYQVADEKVARQLAEKRRIKKREDSIHGSSRMSLDTLFSQMKAGEVKDLNLVVKGDVQGSVEAVNQALTKLSTDEVRVNIVHSAVGAITESDVRLAEVSNAIVIGFNVRPAANVADQAKESSVDLRLYRVIYHAIEDIENAMKGLLAPKLEEVELGQVEIRQVFRASNIGTIGGGYVTRGKIVRNCKIRLVRDGIIIWDGKLASLKRFKDDVREVAQGYECGLSLENFNDIKEGDVIEAYNIEEIERDSL